MYLVLFQGVAGILIADRAEVPAVVVCEGYCLDMSFFQDFGVGGIPPESILFGGALSPLGQCAFQVYDGEVIFLKYRRNLSEEVIILFYSPPDGVEICAGWGTAVAAEGAVSRCADCDGNFFIRHLCPGRLFCFWMAGEAQAS